MPDYRRGTWTPQFLCWVIAFDPGETTGWTVMGILPGWLDGSIKSAQDLQDVIAYIDYGQIDCVAGGGFDDTAHKHAGISFGPEAVGVSKMMDIIWKFPNAAIVVEDFIIDFSKIDQARHTLSPVRIMSMLSYAMYIDAEMPFYSRLFVQGRSMAKTTCNDPRLRRWGLFDAKGGRHARDATRHAFYFLRTCRGNSVKAQENRWRAWPEKFADPQLVPKVPRKKSQGERVKFV